MVMPLLVLFIPALMLALNGTFSLPFPSFLLLLLPPSYFYLFIKVLKLYFRGNFTTLNFAGFVTFCSSTDPNFLYIVYPTEVS